MATTCYFDYDFKTRTFRVIRGRGGSGKTLISESIKDLSDFTSKQEKELIANIKQWAIDFKYDLYPSSTMFRLEYELIAYEHGCICVDYKTNLRTLTIYPGRQLPNTPHKKEMEWIQIYSFWDCKTPGLEKEKEALQTIKQYAQQRDYKLFLHASVS